MSITDKITLPLAHAVRTAEAFWSPIQHRSQACISSSSLSEPALQRQIARVRWPTPKSRYSNLYLTPQPAPHIRLDTRPDAILRARIRLNRAHFNARQHKLQLTDSPLCPTCCVPETDAHVLLECARFDAARFACHAEISDCANIQPPLTFNIFAGDYSRIQVLGLDASAAHDATRSFLRTINRSRPI